jgi:hypothetical protein
VDGGGEGEERGGGGVEVRILWIDGGGGVRGEERKCEKSEIIWGG